MPRPVVGIVAEYNPFHNGHAYHIARIRAALPDASVFCVMSGHVTQRGELSICRKHDRAAMAVHGGADLVVELPALYSCACAERFAEAGVALLSASGLVTHLSFGSEIGEIEPLENAALALDDPSFVTAQSAALKQGLSYPAARHRALASLHPASATALAGPNDLLGVEYLRALRRAGSSILPLLVPREGAAHGATRPDGRFASASFIRARWLAGQDARFFVPEGTWARWESERAAGRAPVSLSACEQAVLAALRRMDPEDFRTLPDVAEGLENRLSRAARLATSTEEFYALVKTKRYTHARIRRIALRAYMDLPRPSNTESPPYLRVLAANESGLRLLREARKTAALPVITKPAAVKRLGTAADCFFHEARVTDLYALCYPDRARRAGGQEWTESPQIL